jgi:phospholipase C
VSPSSTTEYTLTASGNGNSVTSAATVTVSSTPPGQPESQIKHLIILMMQNHSFDNLFGTYPGANGLDPSLPSYHQTDANGKTVSPTVVTTLSTPDLNHDQVSYITAWDNGKMDKYALTNGDLSMQYYDKSVSGLTSDGSSYGIGTLWSYAGQYALADNFFASAMNNEPANGLYMVAATIDSPHTAGSLPQSDACTSVVKQTDGGSVAPPLTEKNVGDQLSSSGISWAWYQESFDTEQVGTCQDYVPQENVFQYFASTQNSSHIQNFTKASFQAALDDGSLPSVVWIQPDGLHSMHPGAGNTLDGVEWLDQTIKAIQQSSIWPNTAILVLWDESGGWYDHVPPPQLAGTQGLGARVPFIVVSPFAKTGYISNKQMDFVSILRFIQWNWNLGQLPAADQQAREQQSGDLCDLLSSSCGAPAAP